MKKEPNSRHNKPVFATEIPLLPDAEVDIADTAFIAEVVAAWFVPTAGVIVLASAASVIQNAAPKTI